MKNLLILAIFSLLLASCNDDSSTSPSQSDELFPDFKRKIYTRINYLGEKDTALTEEYIRKFNIDNNEVKEYRYFGDFYDESDGTYPFDHFQYRIKEGNKINIYYAENSDDLDLDKYEIDEIYPENDDDLDWSAIIEYNSEFRDNDTLRIFQIADYTDRKGNTYKDCIWVSSWSVDSEEDFLDNYKGYIIAKGYGRIRFRDIELESIEF